MASFRRDACNETHRVSPQEFFRFQNEILPREQRPLCGDTQITPCLVQSPFLLRQTAEAGGNFRR